MTPVERLTIASTYRKYNTLKSVEETMANIDMPDYYSFDREFYMYIKTILPPAQANKVFGAMLDYFFTGETDQKLPREARIVVKAMLHNVIKRREYALNKMRNRIYAAKSRELEVEFEPMTDDDAE